MNIIKYGREIGRKPPYMKFIWTACIDCGKERWVHYVKDKPAYLRCLHCANKGELNPSWGGGRIKSGGYILMKLKPEDFFYSMTSIEGKVSEHRLIMAKHLNRCLLPWEIVHHKNGIKDDNRIENLHLLPSRSLHIVDTLTKRRISVLEQRVTFLETENKFLLQRLL